MSEVEKPVETQAVPDDTPIVVPASEDKPIEKKKRILSEKQREALKLGQEKLRQKRLERKEALKNESDIKKIKVTEDSAEDTQKLEHKAKLSRTAREASVDRSRQITVARNVRVAQPVTYSRQKTATFH